MQQYQQELKALEQRLYPEDIRQVQDSISNLQQIHTQQQKEGKNKINNINYNTGNYQEDVSISPNIQNIQDITQIQESIHHTQNLLSSMHNLRNLDQQNNINMMSDSDEEDDIIVEKVDKLHTLLRSNKDIPGTYTNPAAILGSYLPRLVFRRFEEENKDLENKGTFFDNFWGVVLFADISGFTVITKRLLKLGTEGLEFLKNNLSDYFDDLVSLIHEMGGDVISFSGDAVVAVWWTNDAFAHPDLAFKAAERTRLARTAVDCALQIQKTLSNRCYQIGTVDELVLNLRVAVSASHLCGVHVGGVNERWLFTTYGLGISDIAGAMAQCTVGQVIVASSAWKLVGETSVGEPVANGYVRLQDTTPPPPAKAPLMEYTSDMIDWMKLYISPVILSKLSARQENFVGEFRTVTVLFICIHSIDFQEIQRSAPPDPPSPSLPPSSSPAPPSPTPSKTDAGPPPSSPSLLPTTPPPLDETPLPPQVFHTLRSSNSVPRLLVSSLPAPTPVLTSPVASPTPSPAPNRGLGGGRGDGLRARLKKTRMHGSMLDVSAMSQKLQAGVTSIQNELALLEGDLNKLVADDKGLIAIVVFGLPPLSHEDDPLRGVLTAVNIRDQLANLGMECSIGVSTGKAFCGNYGSKGHNRREYTVIGDSVNTSARLMQKANKAILCDGSSYKFSKSKVSFESQDPVILKGYDQPVPVYRPDHVKLLNIKSETPNHQFFGRNQEMELLMNCATIIEKLANRKNKRWAPPKDMTKVVVIEGEQGVGKSALVGVLLHTFRSEGRRLRIVECISDPYKNHGPLHGIWPIFTQFLELSQDVVSNRLRVLSVVADNQNWMRLVPLLNRYLPLDFPSNSLCSDLSDNARIESTIYLVKEMLKVMAKDKPMIIAFENAQWLDKQTWAVLADIVKHVSHILVIVLTRPSADRVDSMALLKSNTVKIKLELLDKDTTIQIVLQHLGAKSFPPQICDMIYSRSLGNPLMCVEAAHYLINAGVIAIEEDGTCTLVNDHVDIDSMEIPSSLEAMITARIDKLLPGPLLTLKVAAIIGKTFSFKLLESIYPIPDAKDELMENLLTLRKLGIITFAEIAKTRDARFLEQSIHGKINYTFKDLLYMEVAYNLMLFGQKRQLHEQIALWYETFLDAISRYKHSKLFSFLIHHWEASGNKERVKHYVRRGIIVARWATLRQILVSSRVIKRFFTRALPKIPSLY